MTATTELIAESCPTCRHARHEGRRCLNMASDSECSCDKRPATAAPSDTDREALDARAILEAARLTPQPEQVTTGSADAKAILGGCDETADCTASTHSSRCWRGHWVTPEGEKR